MERGALGSELDGNLAERLAIWSREYSRFVDVFMASTPFFKLLHCGMLNIEYSPCTAVMKKSNTSYSSVFVLRPVLSCIRTPACSRSRRGCSSLREGGLCELVLWGRCLFGEGSIAYDRSFT